MSKTILSPLHDYVVAENEAAETKTKSGLYLPEAAQEAPKIAVVKAIGNEVKQVKVGDRIIYKSYSTTEIKLDNEEFMLVKEEDILSTVKEAK